MGLIKSIAKRLTAAARHLALVAALVLAAGVHPPHAAAGGADGQAGSPHRLVGEHSHFGATCLQAEVDEGRVSHADAATSGHADCSQIFASPLRFADSGTSAYLLLAVAVPHDLPYRQLATAFDPPPPRHG